jgi:hypothetical protein
LAGAADTRRRRSVTANNLLIDRAEDRAPISTEHLDPDVVAVPKKGRCRSTGCQRLDHAPFNDTT